MAYQLEGRETEDATAPLLGRVSYDEVAELKAGDGGSKQKLQLVEHATYGNGIQLAGYDVVR